MQNPKLNGYILSIPNWAKSQGLTYEHKNNVKRRKTLGCLDQYTASNHKCTGVEVSDSRSTPIVTSRGVP